MSETESPEKTAREYSTVQFPYSHLGDALAVAQAIADRGGVPLSREQLAAALDQKQGSGAFSSKVAAARMFGLIEDGAAGRLKASALAYEALATDEGRSRAARAAAFMNVELFRRLYEEFRGRQLPPRPLGLEEALTGLGVAPKQKTNARYALDKSATLAGFYDHGTDRLVEPLPLAQGAKADAPPPPLPISTQPPEREQLRVKLDPVIDALISKLPFKGPWPAADRKAWLTMMSMAFDMAYGMPGEARVAWPPARRLVDDRRPGAPPLELEGDDDDSAL